MKRLKLVLFVDLLFRVANKMESANDFSFIIGVFSHLPQPPTPCEAPLQCLHISARICSMTNTIITTHAMHWTPLMQNQCECVRSSSSHHHQQQRYNRIENQDISSSIHKFGLVADRNESGDGGVFCVFHLRGHMIITLNGTFALLSV